MINIQITSEIQDEVNIDDEWLSVVCKKIFNDNKKINGDIIIIISDDDKLRKMKRDFFNKDLLTDVIAFNLEDTGDPIEGEIYISFKRVKENAKDFEQEINSELKRVIIHGCLHLLGYDDITAKEKNEMTTLENYYLNEFSIINKENS